MHSITSFSFIAGIEWCSGGSRGGGGRGDHHPPLELVLILKTYAKCAWPGPIPPLWMLVNVQEWVCFSIFWRADDVTRTMSKGGGACECPRVGGVLQNFGGRLTSRGQCPRCFIPPPLQEILYPRKRANWQNNTKSNKPTMKGGENILTYLISICGHGINDK